MKGSCWGLIQYIFSVVRKRLSDDCCKLFFLLLWTYLWELVSYLESRSYEKGFTGLALSRGNSIIIKTDCENVCKLMYQFEVLCADHSREKNGMMACSKLLKISVQTYILSQLLYTSMRASVFFLRTQQTLSKRLWISLTVQYIIRMNHTWRAAQITIQLPHQPNPRHWIWRIQKKVARVKASVWFALVMPRIIRRMNPQTKKKACQLFRLGKVSDRKKYGNSCKSRPSSHWSRPLLKTIP